MATSGQLVKAVADSLNIPAATVALYDRILSEAGIRTKGGRGRSAAQMTTRDAANLLIAVISSPITGPSIAGTIAQWTTYSSLKAIKGSAGRVRGGRRVDERIFDSVLGRKDTLWGYPTDGKPVLTPLDLPGLKRLESGHSPADAIVAIIDATIDGSLEKAINPDADFERINRASGLTLKIRSPFLRITIALESPTWLEYIEYGVPNEPKYVVGTYHQTRTIGIYTFDRIARLFSDGGAS